MLIPSKHSHPDRTIINAAFLLLKKLHKERLCSYSRLQEDLSKAINGGEFLFLPALNFLYLLGLIEYHPKNDNVEFIGRHETL